MRKEYLRVKVTLYNIAALGRCLQPAWRRALGASTNIEYRARNAEGRSVREKKWSVRGLSGKLGPIEPAKSKQIWAFAGQKGSDLGQLVCILAIPE
jgi:hypothetical protein